MTQYQDRFPTGKKSPEVVNVLITASKDSRVFYKITPKGHLIPSKIMEETFPFDYGVIPQAMGDINEPLHALVISSEGSVPKSIAQVKPIALVKIFTGEIQYYYIVGVGLHDPKYASKTSLSELPASIKTKIAGWVSATERLKYKHIKVEWEDEGKARDAIEHCRRVYAKLAYT